MVLEISSAVLARLLAEAAASPGAEVCGLLFGGAGRIEAAAACDNVAADAARTFEIDPTALVAAYRRARCGGPAVIGHYHSHPTGLPAPSATDAAHAMGDGAIWVILGNGEAQAWQTVKRGAFVALALSVTTPG